MNSKLISLLMTNILEKNFEKKFSKEEIESFWEEFYAFPKDLSFDEWIYFKVYNKKPTRNKNYSKCKYYREGLENICW